MINSYCFWMLSSIYAKIWMCPNLEYSYGYHGTLNRDNHGTMISTIKPWSGSKGLTATQISTFDLCVLGVRYG